MKASNLGLASTIIDNILICLYPGDPSKPPERGACVQVIHQDRAVLYCTDCTVSRWYPETKQDKAKQYYDAAVELFKAMHGAYADSAGKTRQVGGDIAKLPFAKLSPAARRLQNNFEHVSATMPGPHETRSNPTEIKHLRADHMAASHLLA